jgi:hypothetical protein
MAKAKVIFQKCIQNSQELGSNSQHMVSRVFFDMEIGGKKYKNLYADVKQPVGGDFETAPLEVSWPKDYEGPFNYNDFRQAVEYYYRSLVGSKGRGIHVQGPGSTFMFDNVFIKKMEVELDLNV